MSDRRTDFHLVQEHVSSSTHVQSTGLPLGTLYQKQKFSGSQGLDAQNIGVLVITSPSLRGFVLISFCPREKFGQKMGFLPGAQETLIPSLIRS